MDITIRPATPEDAKIFGEICYEAFKNLADQHNFPPDFPSAEVATGMFSGLLSHPKFYSVAAELDGQVVGSIVVSERSSMAGISVLTVNPSMQNNTAGRQLMQHALSHLEGRFSGIQLIQAAYHARSLCLYAKVGFEAREMLSTMQGPALNIQIPGYTVRPATEDDMDACNQVCVKIHGHDHSGELRDAIQQGTATVVEHEGHISGYATMVAFFGHAVGETNEDLKALIGAAPEFPGPGFLVPTRNGELFRWCLEHNLRLVMQVTLMSYGQYNEPEGPFLPSILC